VRILIFGDSAGTGFGTVTRNLSTRLLDRGHDVQFVSMNEQQGSSKPGYPFEGRMLLTGNRAGWLDSLTPEDYGHLVQAMAEDRVTEADRERLQRAALIYRGIRTILGLDPGGAWVAEAVLIIGDPGGLEYSGLHKLIPATVRAVHYVPIEGVGTPPRWAQFWQTIEPVAMSQFGAAQLREVLGREVAMAYHGVDTSAFWPVSELRPIRLTSKMDSITLTSKQACKEFVAHAARQLSRWNPDPSHLWILRADRHMPRKMYSSLFRSLSLVLRKHPDVEFLFHCRQVDEGGNLADDVSKLPDLWERINGTGFHETSEASGATLQAMNAIYNAADIYVSNSAEGFGLTLAEAMACGVPVVGLDYSSVPEVVGDAGILVPAGSLVDNKYGYWWARPDEAAYAEAVHRLVQSRGARRDLGAKGTDRVRRLFSWEVAVDVIEQRLLVPVEVPA
jgi:glycosyltransferase involved in cell wall biosynthesis